MRVFLTKSPTDRQRVALDRMIESAKRYSGDEYSIVESPEEADLILYLEDWDTDQLLRQVRRDPLYRKYRRKCIVIHENAGNVPLLPGIFASIHPRYAKPEWARAGSYIWMMRDSWCPDYRPDAKYLYSFIGSAYTHPVRQRILQLDDERAHLEDTGPITQYMRYKASLTEKKAWQRRYDRSLAESAFVLCPRGVGSNSIRLYETMRAGRVPVVISDALVLPDGPDWNSFLIRVSESDVESIPQLLKNAESRHDEMGLRAKHEWNAWFSADNMFETFANWARELQANRVDGPVRRRLRWSLALTPTYFMDFARYYKRKLVNR